jgi:hypothetical protein
MLPWGLGKMLVLGQWREIETGWENWHTGRRAWERVLRGTRALVMMMLIVLFIASHATFSSGDPRFAELDKKLYVGSGRFVLEEGKDTVVEYKLSEVIP